MQIDSGRAVARIAARTMDLSAAYEQAPDWQRLIFVVNGIDIVENRRQIEGWYRELAARDGSLSINCGLQIFTSSVKYPPPGCEARDVPAEGWFADRIAQSRLAESPDPSEALSLERRERRRSDHTFRKLCAFHGLSTAFVLIGIVCCFALIFSGRGSGRSAWKLAISSGRKQRLDQSLWPGGIGVRGLGAALVAGFIVVCLLTGIVAELMSVRAMCVFLAVLLTVISVLYLQKHKHSFLGLLGIGQDRESLLRLAASTLALSGASMAGSTFIQWIFERIGKPAHWTEWYNEDLVFGAPSLVGVLLVAKCVFSPLVEEIVFRGFLFGICKRIGGAHLAIVFSALVFGFAHSAGLPTFLTLTWCGLVWAFGYEKTGSIVPAILSHSLNNILYSLSILVFLR